MKSPLVLGQGAYVYLTGTFLIPTAALPRCYITAVDSNQKLWLFYSEDDFRYSTNNTEYFTIWAWLGTKQSIFGTCRSRTMSGCADQQMESSCSKSQVCFEGLDCMKTNNCRRSGGHAKLTSDKLSILLEVSENEVRQDVQANEEQHTNLKQRKQKNISAIWKHIYITFTDNMK